MHIWWRQTTWVVLVTITTHIPHFINVAHTVLWIFDFFVISHQNRYANEVSNMHIWWRQTTWVVFVPPPTTHIPSLTKIGHCILIRELRFTFWCWRETYISTYICIYRQRDKWKLSGPSSIAGGPQKSFCKYSSIWLISTVLFLRTYLMILYTSFQHHKLLLWWATSTITLQHTNHDKVLKDNSYYQCRNQTV